jgi:hypothetical protein
LTVKTTAGAINVAAWDGTAVIIGPNAASASGANFAVGYDTVSDGTYMYSLAPGVAWKPLTQYALTINQFISGLSATVLNSTGWTLGQANGGGLMTLAVNNTSNTAGSHARVWVGSAGGSGGDSQVYFIRPGVFDYTMGLYAGDSSFRIGIGNSLSANPVFIISGAGVMTDAAGFELGWKVLPRTDTNGGTAAVAVRGKCQYLTGTSTYTIPNATFAQNDIFSIVAGAGATTIAQGAGLTMRLAGTSLTGNRTLSLNGMASIWFVSSAECFISGAGVS